MCTLFYKRNDIKNKSQYNQIADEICRGGIEQAKELILENVPKNPRATFIYDHNMYCGFTLATRRTEKRWCRCLRNFAQENRNTDCDNCCINIDHNLAKPIANAKIIEFEVPVSGDGNDSIGEIDLIIDFNKNKYAVEVKPMWNSESLLRMIAEIVTYCAVVEGYSAFKDKYGECKKAILFVKDSEQYKQWTDENYRYYANDEIRALIKHFDISVFCIEKLDDKYMIKDLAK